MPVITAENLSKLYHFNDARPNSLRDVITSYFSRSDRSNGRGELWALRDINFAVEAGETLGIIGKNGAGKSTLLRVLSRITKPTRGRARVYGRVGSLLEVGTGFHPELTG